ncbi:MAG: hypothetical protein NTW31_08720 [Bacteroidetes bacterium]|nr:hypothetical protein [Bacteroidota bacterium]
MKFILCCLILFPIAVTAQVSDDFTDGNFTSNPSWTGDTSAFTVNAEHQLKLNSSGSDTSCLSTQSLSLQAMEWSFWIKISFNTSLNNYTRVYLGSDSPDLKGLINAVYLQIGGSGDSIMLYRQNGNMHSLLFRFPFLRTNKSVNVFRIKVRRDTVGNWDLFADSTGGRQFSRYGNFTDIQMVPSAWFGVFCRYTSSNSTKICFDDFYAGRILLDTVPPKIISCGFSDSLTIRIKFNEVIDSSCIKRDLKYSLKNNPEKLIKAYILKTDPGILFIRINQDNTDFFCDSLRIQNISDLANNFLTDTSVLICYYIPGPCRPGDMVINEVLFHPDVSGSKFIEFYNCSSKIISLNTLLVGNSGSGNTSVQPERLCSEERFLAPKDFFVVSADSSKLCSRYYVPYPGKVAGMEHFPSLNSDSGYVFLKSAEDSMVIDAMSYSESMHLSFLTNTIGVSLERLDPRIPSNCRANWQSASETSGFASPGYDNSHYVIDPGNGLDLQLSSSIFSPDNDGLEDLLYIKVNNVEAGTLLTLRIFDIKGNLIKIIAGSSTVSENSLFLWDGTGENSLIVNMGYYIVFAESLGVSGKHSNVKRAVVVAWKL